MKIGFVTCEPAKLAYYFPTRAEPLLVPTELPFTPDDQIAVDALRMRGHDVTSVQWGSPIVELGDYDLIVVRSPWDYMDSPDKTLQFFAWIDQVERAGIKVANPPHFMRWLLDKRYLADLAVQGVSVIPTVYLDINANINLLTTFKEKGAFILKPCISAAGVGLYFIDSMQAAVQYQDDVTLALATRAYMQQDFVPEIMTKGEWSLIFIGGKYSHAIHKMPAANEIMVHAERGGGLNLQVLPPQHVINFAVDAYSGMLKAYFLLGVNNADPASIAYLRLDMIDTESGPVLLECEGVEPELFFRAGLHSVTCFSEVIESQLVTLAVS